MSGQVGTCTIEEVVDTPHPVCGELVFVSLSTGWLHTCGVIATGDVYCWGNNRNGQLGNAGPDAFGPVRVGG